MESQTNQSGAPRSSFCPLAIFLALAAGALACLMRLFPLAWNLTPVGALALFAGARLRSWYAFALPLGVMLVTDVLLAFQRSDYPFIHETTLVVYFSFMVNVVLGWTLSRTENPIRIGVLTLLASLQFFVVTNFGVWVAACINPTPTLNYPPTLAGLMECYVAAIPFYRGTLAGDVVFSVLLFGSHIWLTRTYFVSERVTAMEPVVEEQQR